MERASGSAGGRPGARDDGAAQGGWRPAAAPPYPVTEIPIVAPRASRHAGVRCAPMTTAATFNALMGALDYPMFIVTTRVGETRAGCLVGFAGQVSIDPPRFMACLSDKNRTYRVAADGADHLVVHLVPERAVELAELFGGRTGDE